jgi:hypothetical protein
MEDKLPACHVRKRLHRDSLGRLSSPQRPYSSSTRDPETPRLRDSETPRLRDPETPRPRDSETLRHLSKVRKSTILRDCRKCQASDFPRVQILDIICVYVQRLRLAASMELVSSISPGSRLARMCFRTCRGGSISSQRCLSGSAFRRSCDESQARGDPGVHGGHGDGFQARKPI